MKRVNLIAIAFVVALVGALTLNVAAQDWNKNQRTYLTFSGTVELPGATLQPGTYLFRLADSPSNRHIVQVLNEDESQIHATILAVPSERLEVTGENVVTFRETAEGATPAVQYWYYPGDRIGHEFVYPKDQATRIAQRTGQNVLTSDGDVASAEGRVTSMGPDGQESEWSREGAPTQTAEAQPGTVEGTAGVSEMPEAGGQAEMTTESTEQEAVTAQAGQETVDPASETQDPATETAPAEPTASQTTSEPMTTQTTEPEQQTATATGTTGTTPVEQPRVDDQRAVGTTGQAPEQTMAQDRAELPRTASPLPLSGLIGLLSLGGALTLRRVRK